MYYTVAGGQGVHITRCNNLPETPAKSNSRNGSQQRGHRQAVPEPGQQVQEAGGTEPGADGNHIQRPAQQLAPLEPLEPAVHQVYLID